uniref:Uncharacterized protein n=1 Tax=Solanum tuberosum TaxID=4113 RepID=M1AQ56_SOLTU
MSYIPPHKRHTKGSPSPIPTPAPESLIPALKKREFQVVWGAQRKEKYLGGILYAHRVVRKWFPVGLTNDSQCEAPTCFYAMANQYLMVLSDNLRSDSTAACKCTVIKDQGKIQLNKVSSQFPAS